MPLDVIQINRGKQESIFEKLNPFVEKLVGAYKQKKQNEWDADWQLEAMRILESAGNQKSSENLLANVNPPEGYIDIEGATNWAKETVGSMTMHEQMMGVKPEGSMTIQEQKMGIKPGTMPVKATEQVSGEQPGPLPDKMEWDTAFKMISELAPGQTDWSSLTAMFKKRIESGKAMGTAAQSFLNMIMGQQPTDQRAELGRNIDMTNKYMDAFYPETEEEGVVFDPEQFKRDNPDMYISGYNSNTGGYTFKKKEDEEPKLDIEKFNKWITDSGFVIKGGTVNPVTGSQSYNFGPGKKSFDQAIKDAKKWVKENPGMEIGNINFTTETVSVRQKGKDEPEPGKGRPNMDKFLFGDTGIINDYIKSLIDDGTELTDEDKELVIKNYKLRKGTLTEEEIAEVELYFDQIGIDPEAGPKVELPEGPQSKPSALKDLLTPPAENLKNQRDKYGYVLGEEKIGTDGKKYKYMGNDEWKPVY